MRQLSERRLPILSATLHSCTGQGQMKPEQLEIARLKREVIKLKAERDMP